MRTYTIGGDPELAVRNGDMFVSAHDLILGTKDEPYTIPGGAVQVDGVAAEFNITPSSSAEGFTNSIQTILTNLSRTIKAKDPSLSLAATPVATFSGAYWKTLPKEVKRLGCMPDFNAWTGKPNDPPHTRKPFRTFGGHVAVGWDEALSVNDEKHIAECVNMTKQLDVALFMVSALWDDDGTRRSLYGKAGSYRPTTFGVEYRPLSCAWVRDPDLHKWVFNTAVHAAELLEDKTMLWNDLDLKEITQEAIESDTLDKDDSYYVHKILQTDFGFPALPESYLTWGDDDE